MNDITRTSNPMTQPLRPKRENYPLTLEGDHLFNHELLLWQYEEIDRRSKKILELEGHLTAALAREELRRTTPEPPAELWCVHIIGPDDLYAAPSEAEAERAAAWMTRFWEERHPDDAALEFVGFEAIPWPHSPESHAESVGMFYTEIGLSPPTAPSSPLPAECSDCLEPSRSPWHHVIRFCAEGGVRSSPFRTPVAHSKSQQKRLETQTGDRWRSRRGRSMAKTSIELPLNRSLGFMNQCSHGKAWSEFCRECRIVSLTESLKWMEPQVQRDRAELEMYQRMNADG